MRKIFKTKNYYLAILMSGLIPAVICQSFIKEPVSRNIHVRNFRYGKDPSVIRCNRGDTLHLTFSTDDTGHSFFLQEFDFDAKISPARDMVEVFSVSDPSVGYYQTEELVFVARHGGLLNYLVSRSNYRCHVWCGPMHAFESGNLIILPNTLLVFNLGTIAGIVILWLISIFSERHRKFWSVKNVHRDILGGKGILRKLAVSRWPQVILTIVAMILIYVVILTSLLGTRMSGRNLGVLLMWGVWLFLLVAILTPAFGRIWCTICPLPFLGDLYQRGSFFNPSAGKTGKYNNHFRGFFLRWPSVLTNNWTKLFFFMLLATFSTTMVANPRVSAVAVIALFLMPVLMAFFFELRAFCRYICPISVFVAPFSRMSRLALRPVSSEVCTNCKAKYCKYGNIKGWACPYGLNTGEIRENTDCGLCFECMRSCSYNNVTVYSRPFASELGTRNYGDAWLALAVFTLAIIYSILYEGHWPVVRDFVNILDKKNWDLFGIYTAVFWSISLVVIPGMIYLISVLAGRVSRAGITTRDIFLGYSGSLIPLGLTLWIAFVIPMLFVNVTFIFQSFSDPFGWGWDLMGTSNIPWHQFVPEMVPWMQALLILSGLFLSLRNLYNTWQNTGITAKQVFYLLFPLSIVIISASVMMIFFFTN